MSTEIQEDSGDCETAPGVSTVAIAVSGSRSSRHALKWALDKFVPGGRVLFRILHVRPPITMVPTPMGNYIPVSQVRDDVASAYREELEWQARNMLLPYKKMCAQRQVEAEAVLLESDDVPAAISEEINKFNIGKLVLGSSSRSIFRRKLKGSKTATKISECIPSFCTAYVVSKGKLSFVRSATSDACETPKTISSSTVSSPSFRSLSSAPSECADRNEAAAVLFRQSSLSSQRDHALANINRRASPSGSGGSEISYHADTTLMTNSHSIASGAQLSSSSSGDSVYKSFRRDSSPDIPDLQAAVSEIATNLKHSHDQKDDLKLQIESMKVKLRHLQKLHECAHTEPVDSTQKLHNNLGIQRVEHEIKLREIDLTEEMVRRLLRRMEREEKEVAEREAQPIQTSSGQKATEGDGDHQNAGKINTGLKNAGRCLTEYNRYSWEHIQAATSSFSSDLVIGKGTYGTVYKAKFQHTVAAVKVLNSLEGFGTQQLQQELEVLGKIRHPHLLLLLGACPEHGCVVYEYMESGSLDDALHHRRNGTPPLAWYDRVRIAWEVATAVAFLHSARPDPIIHRDLKPANILLDRNLASKVGDVGLSTALLHHPGTGGGGGQQQSTMVRNTTPVGTFCYIDPEYQRTGAVSAKSDVYALGVVVLQLLTGRTSPLGLAHAVETTLEEDSGDSFAEMLDTTAGEWPPEEARELALLALRCAEMRRRDRPGLREHILPALERIKDVAARAARETKALLLRTASSSAAPGHFLCPILQEIMEDPCVAADGYTYDRKAIETWVSMKDKSPMTNLRLPSKSLIPNHSLRSAIMDWSSKNR
ncbi:U-box domain-containing protein 35-like isoform X1 [Triticum dicoccoides]|uniref:U-box domain-containing protein 35-like isoform X1 n=1 Tax=Triticum dicoccoides TaxID=85692 RepID=UPI00188ED49F|nr:U-box domain-containing protein 35-like isoform X1 [Triticum dicoccoides]